MFIITDKTIHLPTMFLRCGLVILFLNCVKTREYSRNDFDDGVSDFNRFAVWPSVHNAARMMRVTREAQKKLGLDVGFNASDTNSNIVPPTITSTSIPLASQKLHSPEFPKVISTTVSTTNKPFLNETKVIPTNVTIGAVVSTVTNGTDKNITAPAKNFDLNKPGVVKRGLIVFGGFALLAGAYYIFYRRKGKNNETSNTHNLTDANQFRYGVLQSEDRRDTELSRMPLTMVSDDEEDEDLEIFDLKQKKKSLSYVNLQTKDEDVVFSLKDNEEDEKDNLLLDIEDGNSETLINWSSNGNNKSIL